MVHTHQTEVLTLRDYQQRAVNDVSAEFASGTKNILLTAPTGSGKTKIAAGFINTLPETAKTFYLTNNSELVKQTMDQLNDIGMNVARADYLHWKPNDPMPVAKTIITSPTVFLNRDGCSLATENDYLIVDECHHAPAASWRSVIDNFPGHVLGLSATPQRLDPNESFEGLFDKLIVNSQPKELIDAAHLSDPITYTRRNRQELIVGYTHENSEYVASEIYRRTEQTILTDKAIEWWIEKTNGNYKSIFYCLTKVHAYTLERKLIALGISAIAVTDDTKKSQREQIMKDFKDGIYTCLLNVTIYTEGVDCPDANCGVLLRPTESLTLYLQMVGRIMRVSDQRPIILDATDNTLRFGLPSQDREWSLKPKRKPSDETKFQSFTKQCTDCEALIEPGYNTCPNCGYEFGTTCPKCGAWRAWSQWISNDGVCDPCEREKYVDTQRDLGIAIPDGWEITRKGNPKLRHGQKEAILYEIPMEPGAYAVYLTEKDRRWKIRIENSSERTAKRTAENELGLYNTMLGKRMDECQDIIKRAYFKESNQEKRSMLNDAGFLAIEIKEDLQDIKPNHASRYRKRFDTIVDYGTQVRETLNEKQETSTIL